MRFSIAAVLAFATSTLAQVEGFHVITQPQKGEKVAAGSTYEIVWQPDAKHPGEVTIGLLGGATPSTLSIVDTIAKGVDGSLGSYDWAVSTKLGDLATYGIMITLESDKDVFQYGFPFQIVNAGGEGDDEGDDRSDGDQSTSTTTSATGTASKTGSSSSATKTTASSTDSTTVTIPSSTFSSSTISSNLSTTAIITNVVTGGPSSTTSATSTIVTNGVASMAAGGFAMLGGVAMAVLAL